MGWRNASAQNGAASIGAYYFFGGVLMNVAAVLEVRLVPILRGIVIAQISCVVRRWKQLPLGCVRIIWCLLVDLGSDTYSDLPNFQSICYGRWYACIGGSNGPKFLECIRCAQMSVVFFAATRN